MRKRPKQHLSSVQLPLFAEEASLVRIRPDLNEWRYYRMEVWPDLFGRARFWSASGAGSAPKDIGGSISTRFRCGT